jgi:DNA-directed RNA polymerase specialized sigma24 family protein
MSLRATHRREATWRDGADGRLGETLGGRSPVLVHWSALSEPRPRRPVPLPPDAVAAVGDVRPGTTPEAELLERLESALRLLPAAERRAVLTAHADGEGVEGVAALLDLADEDAEALTRSALQLLRGALADVDNGPAPAFGAIPSRPSAARRRAD